MTEPSSAARSHPLLRPRDGHHARVTFEELFFDLVYVFAVTRLSHGLLHHLSLAGAVETLVLWFAVWLGWQYTCWVTNWFDPETPRIRGLLFTVMLAALVMAAAIPEAFGDRGMIFALAYAAMQVGRTAYIVAVLGRDHPLAPNYRRMLGWLVIAAVFWIAGGLMEHEARLALWAVAVVCEYVSPMIGFALPGLGRSRTTDWTIEGAHLAERCHLFVIVALGETLLTTGAALSDAEHWDGGTASALGAAFLGTLALWWLYFGTASRDATATITRSRDPGRIGALFHYVHAVLVAGIIGCAVANELLLAHPHEEATAATIAVFIGGPALYLLGSAAYKWIVYDCFPLSSLIGALALAVLVPIGLAADLLAMSLASTVVMLVVGTIEWRAQQRYRAARKDPARGGTP